MYINTINSFGNNVNNMWGDFNSLQINEFTLNQRRFFILINKVEICGVNTSKLPMLSNEEKQELLIKIKNGDTDVREKFIQGNLRLVLSVVQRFGGRGENPDDLF